MLVAPKTSFVTQAGVADEAERFRGAVGRTFRTCGGRPGIRMSCRLAVLVPGMVALRCGLAGFRTCGQHHHCGEQRQAVQSEYRFCSHHLSGSFVVWDGLDSNARLDGGLGLENIPGEWQGAAAG
jgi:hypothetical protein